MTRPLLTIAIPTWNRSSYLALTLDQLARERAQVAYGSVEIIVSDNCSNDDTRAVVDARAAELSLTYIRNAENVGSDANTAQCFNLASGDFVLILGDDDLLLDGTLALLMKQLSSGEHGVVCLRPYGYEHDFRREYPGSGGTLRNYVDPGDFLAAIGPYVTLISSCVINKRLLADVDATTFCGGNLVQMHLVVRAALRATTNLFIDQYRLACKRNNSGGYDFSRVFVEEFGRILDSTKPLGLTGTAIRKIETRMLISYYPLYLFRQRLDSSGDLAATRARFSARFGDRWIYKFWLAPILVLPRPLALTWGAIATALGRGTTGDLRRGLAFVWNRLIRTAPVSAPSSRQGR